MVNILNEEERNDLAEGFKRSCEVAGGNHRRGRGRKKGRLHVCEGEDKEVVLDPGTVISSPTAHLQAKGRKNLSANESTAYITEVKDVTSEGEYVQLTDDSGKNYISLKTGEQ